MPIMQTIMQTIKNKKNLTASEEVIKNLLEELIRLSVNLNRFKEGKIPKRIVDNIIIILLKNPKKTFTFQNLFDMLLGLMRMSKRKEIIAITSRIFNLVQTAYKDALKQKS